MSKNIKYLFVFVLFIIASFLIICFFKYKSTFKSISNSNTIKTIHHQTINVGDRKTGLELGFRKGDHILYDISYDLNAKIKNKDTKDLLSKFQIKYAGELTLNIYDEDDNGWFSGFDIQNLKYFVSADDGKYVSHDELINKMKGEVLVFISGKGIIKKIVFPKDMDNEVINNWKNIISEWQVLLPNDKKEEINWTKAETDTMGSYFAKYSKLNHNKPIEIEKIKTNYIAIHSNNNEQEFKTNLPDIYSSLIKIRLDPYQTYISGKEELLIDIGIGNIESSYSFTFKLIERKNISEICKKSEEKKSIIIATNGTSDLSLNPTDVIQNKDASQNASSKGIKEMLSELIQIIANKGIKSQEALDLMVEMIDSISKDSANVPLVLESLAQNKDNIELASGLTGILGAANTKESQQGLINIFLNKSFNDNVREMSLQSLLQVKSPISELDKALMDIYSSDTSFKNTGILILGAVGNKIMDTEPERFEEIKNKVFNIGNNSLKLNIDDQMNILLAIGNLGGSEIPGFIKEYLKDDNELLRKGALNSIEKNYSSQAYDIICDSMINDTSIIVRTEAANLLGETSRLGAKEFLMKQFKNENNEDVKISMLNSVFKWKETDPDIKVFINTISDSESSEKVRDHARELFLQFQIQ